MTHSANSASMILAIALLVPMVSGAQSATTNWSMTAPNIRQVDGKFYNVDLSVLFTNFDGECRQLTDNGIVIHEYQTQPIYKTEPYGGVSTGNFLSGGTRQVLIGQKVVTDKDVFILHFPTNSPTVLGSKQQGRAMPMGVTNINGETIELYDYGTRGVFQALSTNRVK